MTKRFFYLLLFFGTIFFVLYQNIFACRCMYIENPKPEFVVEQHTKAVAVFAGEVLEVDIEKVKFKIEKVWKGEFEDELKMSTGGKIINENISLLHSTCDFDFQKGETYLVFAFGENFEDMKATKCNLTNQLRKARETEKILDERFAVKKEKRVSLSEVWFEHSFYSLLAVNFS